LRGPRARAAVPGTVAPPYLKNPSRVFSNKAKTRVTINTRPVGPMKGHYTQLRSPTLMEPSHVGLVVFFFALLASLAPQRSEGADYSYNGGTSASAWGTTTTWNPNGTPGSSDNIIGFGGTGSLTFNSSRAINNVTYSTSGSTLTSPAIRGIGTVSLTIGGNLLVDYSAGSLSILPNTTTANVSVLIGGNIDVTSGTLNLGSTVAASGLQALSQTNTSTTTVGGTLNINLTNNATATLGHLVMNGGTTTLNMGGSTAGGTTVSSLSDSSGTVRGGTGSNATTTLTINSITNTTYSGVLTNGSSSNTLTVVKTGTGTQVLSGTLDYTGATTISNGVLELGGSATANNSAVNVDAGATLRFDNSANVTRTNTISGGGAVVKAGSSTVTLTANNGYTGTTTVTGGRLLVNGTNTSSAVIVQGGGALGGSGRVGDLTVSGLLAPGNSTGTLSAGNTVFDTGDVFELEMFNWTGTAGTGWDLLAVTGDLTLSNTALNPFTINLVSLSSTNTPGLSSNFDPAQSFTNTFVTYTGSLLGNAFAADLFTVNTSAFSNSFTGTFSITNIAGGLALLYQAPAGPIAYDWAIGSGLWSDDANWSDNAAPTNGASVSFSGAGGASTNNTVVSSITGLTFSNGAGSYTISGDSLTVGSNGIVNNSAAVQTVVNDLTLGDSLEVSAVSGAIVVGGATALAGNNLTYAAAQAITNSGVISGSGQVIKTGAGDLVLAGQHLRRPHLGQCGQLGRGFRRITRCHQCRDRGGLRRTARPLRHQQRIHRGQRGPDHRRHRHRQQRPAQLRGRQYLSGHHHPLGRCDHRHQCGHLPHPRCGFGQRGGIIQF
jgi:autotransporter-associated beta strand protein